VISLAHHESAKMKLKFKQSDPRDIELLLAVLGSEELDPFGSQFHEAKFVEIKQKVKAIEA